MRCRGTTARCRFLVLKPFKQVLRSNRSATILAVERRCCRREQIIVDARAVPRLQRAATAKGVHPSRFCLVFRLDWQSQACFFVSLPSSRAGFVVLEVRHVALMCPILISCDTFDRWSVVNLLMQRNEENEHIIVDL